MPCDKVTDRICRVSPSAEGCAPLKPVLYGLPPLDGLTFESDGSSIVVTWDVSISYPEQLVRGHVRRVDTVGYPADGFQLVPRNDGAMAFTGLDEGAEYHVWLRAEDADEATDWLRLKYVCEDGPPIAINLVLHNGEVVTHLGEVVVY